MDVSGWGSCLERPAACWLDRWLFLLSNGVPTESWSHYGLASMVHLMLAVSQDGAVALLERPTACWPDRWLFLLSNGVPTESWSHYGLASMVHLMLAGVSGRGSCLERPTTCCHNRWSILPSNGVPMEPWSQCGLASVVHLVLAGGSGRYDGTSPITWQGRWSALLRHKGLESWCWYGLASTVHPCWWMAQDGAVALRGPLHAATTDGRFLQATESPWSRGVSVAWHPSCTLWWQVAQGDLRLTIAKTTFGADCGWFSARGSYHGTSAIRWQGRWSVLLVHKGPRSPGMVDSSMQRSPHGAVESVCPGIHGAPHASRWLRTDSYDGTSPITWQGRWLALLRHKGLESWCWYDLASTVHPCCWMAQDRAVALRGLLHAATTDGRFLQATESPWSRGVSVAWHPSCTLWWQVAQDDLRLTIAKTTFGADCGWFSARGSYHGTSAIRWQGRWSVLLVHKGPRSPGMVDSSTQRSPHGAVESVCPGIHGAPHASRWLRTHSYDGTSPITWQGRWSALLRHKGLESWCWYGLASTVHPCWWMAQDGAVALRGPLHAATTDVRFLQATESPWSRGVSVAWHPSCTLWWQVAQGDLRLTIAKTTFGADCGWFSARGSYHGTSAIRWQGRWSVLPVHKGPQSPGGLCPGETCHVLPQQMVDSSKQQSPHGVMESVCPGIHGAPRASRWLRTGQLSWDIPHILARNVVHSSEPQRPPESWSHYGLASMVHPC
uniref:uncharacterized protein LOC100894745 isoform X5 n=1 Tax=Callithrix jacchus TaxID=9483 RepID=UPI0023DD09E9|nr:uncharacterized protein LOC100894745 isoform X5 [Callithrix jacchus]